MPDTNYENYPVDDRPTDFKPFPEEIVLPNKENKPKKNNDENDPEEEMSDELERTYDDNNQEDIPDEELEIVNDDYMDDDSDDFEEE